jgi:hypothetical protein
MRELIQILLSLEHLNRPTATMGWKEAEAEMEMGITSSPSSSSSLSIATHQPV